MHNTFGENNASDKDKISCLSSRSEEGLVPEMRISRHLPVNNDAQNAA